MFYNVNFKHSNNIFYPDSSQDINAGKNYWRSGVTCDKWYISDNSHTTYCSNSHIFFYPYIVGEIFPLGNISITDTNYLVTPLDTFYNTVHINFETPCSNPLKPHSVQEFYITKNIGITKYLNTENEIWELINFNIVK